MRRKKNIIILAAVLLVLILLTMWLQWGNTALQLTTYTISSSRLPGAFDGFRIAQISDLHNAEFGEDNEKLIAMLKEAKPDMIAITGDFIDGRRTDVDVALKFAAEAVKIAPCYYVTGNHEQRTTAYFDLKNGLKELGVCVLEDAWVELERNGEKIRIIGVMDPSYPSMFEGETEADVMSLVLKMLSDENTYSVLLSHRPDMFEVYAQNNMDLALTGHAHGGQIRLPFVGAVLIPDQGWFPKYDAGLFVEGNTQMIISRGLGNSVFPLRINNRPEVVLVELKCE